MHMCHVRCLRVHSEGRSLVQDPDPETGTEKSVLCLQRRCIKDLALQYDFTYDSRLKTHTVTLARWGPFGRSALGW